MRNYTTQMDAARKNIITPEMEKVAYLSSLRPEAVRAYGSGGVPAVPAHRGQVSG